MESHNWYQGSAPIQGWDLCDPKHAIQMASFYMLNYNCFYDKLPNEGLILYSRVDYVELFNTLSLVFKCVNTNIISSSYEVANVCKVPVSMNLNYYFKFTYIYLQRHRIA